jgi:hypothetical protein
MTYEEFKASVETWVNSQQPGQVIADGSEEIEFSKAECECCNRPNLDGKRHSVLIREPDSTNYTVFLCPDCFDYLAHGHLDWWNGEINTK